MCANRYSTGCPRDDAITERCMCADRDSRSWELCLAAGRTGRSPYPTLATHCLTVTGGRPAGWLCTFFLPPTFETLGEGRYGWALYCVADWGFCQFTVFWSCLQWAASNPNPPGSFN